MKITLKSKHSNIQKGGEKKMRYSKIILALGVVIFVLATLITSWAAEDVRNSKHNLSTNPNILAQGTTEVCVFCHTPHGGVTTVGGGAAPLWNRNLSSATYTVYTSPNFDAAGATPGTPKGVSVACLSCHDGTVAFDSLINFGGSGSTNNITGFNGSYVASDKTFKEGVFPPDPFPNLGTNLSNDHPISMEIPCTGANADPQFSQICSYINTPSLTAGKVSYLSRSNDFTLIPDTRNRLRAYPSNQDAKPYIECASCHNPHEATSTRFLRHPSIDTTVLPLPSGITAAQLDSDRNMGSLLCLSCHQK